jgi:hypothetical protein
VVVSGASTGIALMSGSTNLVMFGVPAAANAEDASNCQGKTNPAPTAALNFKNCRLDNTFASSQKDWQI